MDLRLLADAMPQLVWSARADGTVDFYNRRALEFEGLTQQADGSWLWAPVLHPEDEARTVQAFAQAVATGQPYEVEHRVRLKTGEMRWFISRGLPALNPDGSVRRWYGTATDIHALKTAEAERLAALEQQTLLAQELHHRVKNILSVVQSLVMLTARADVPMDQFREEISGRLAALGSAQDLLLRKGWSGAALEDLARSILSPFADSSRLSLQGPPVLLASTAAVTLGLALHELATNAVKYGALSQPSGRIQLHWQEDAAPEGAEIGLHWRESDGPVVVPPARRGFGSRLIERALLQDLAREARIEFPQDGVQCLIRMPLSQKIRLHAGPAEAAMESLRPA